MYSTCAGDLNNGLRALCTSLGPEQEFLLFGSCHGTHASAEQVKFADPVQARSFVRGPCLAPCLAIRHPPFTSSHVTCVTGLAQEEKLADVANATTSDTSPSFVVFSRHLWPRGFLPPTPPRDPVPVTTWQWMVRGADSLNAAVVDATPATTWCVGRELQLNGPSGSCILPCLLTGARGLLFAFCVLFALCRDCCTLDSFQLAGGAFAAKQAWTEPPTALLVRGMFVCLHRTEAVLFCLCVVCPVAAGWCVHPVTFARFARVDVTSFAAVGMAAARTCIYTPSV